jgi:hypothetical protein
LKAYLAQTKFDQEKAQQIVDLALQVAKDFSGASLQSNRFLTGMIGCLAADHPEVAGHLKSQGTDQPRIVVAADEDIPAAAAQQAEREPRRIVAPGSAVPPGAHYHAAGHPHKH